MGCRKMAIEFGSSEIEGTAQPVRLRRLMTFREVIAATGYSRPSIYRLERAGRFPKRVKLGEGYGGKVGFWADEVATWLATRTA